MTNWFTQTGRRLFIGAGLAFAIGAPTIACMGGDEVAEDGDEDGTDDGEDGEEEEAGNRMVGTWQMQPDENSLRELRVIDAVLNPSPAKKKGLEPLTAEDQKIFKEWKNKKSGPEADLMRAQIKFMKGSQFTFTDDQVTVAFGSEKMPAVDYTVESDSDKKTVLKFDPGLGNGMETHAITWKSKDKGIDNISTAGGQEFLPLDIKKKN